MKFHKKSFKLAGLYLAILMIISLFFSANLYQLSVQEFERGIRRPPPSFNLSIGQNIAEQIRDQLLQNREDQFKEAKDHVIARLILINLLILIGGGMLSYYLALRTLRPIEETHESLERFTADASHELRTPITAMLSENEVTLMSPKLTLAEAKDQIKSNIEELEKLTKLSDGLLRLASLENNHLPKSPVSIEKLVGKSIDRVMAQAEQKQIRLINKSKIKASVMVDEDSLVEALVILLENAVKYSPPKSQVTIQTTRKQRTAAIKIIDKGIGIKAEELPLVFERFYRADTARSKQQTGGYGLGLAIAKNIADLHSGSLSVESKPGKGSTFILTLPSRF